MSGATLLIAEDEPIERDATAQFVRESLPVFERVEVASNGFELVDKAVRCKPDVLLVDVEMPGMSGLDGIGLLRRKGLRGRVIIYSAFNYFDYAQEGIKLGVDAYLVKPARRSELLSVLSDTAERALKDRRFEKEAQMGGSLAAKASSLLQSEFIKAVTSDDADRDSLPLCVSLLDIPLDSGCMAVLKLRKPGTALKTKELRSLLKEQDESRIQVIAGELKIDECALYLYFPDRLDDGNLMARAMSWAAGLRSTLGELYNVNAELVLGSPCRRIEDLAPSYAKALSQLRGIPDGSNTEMGVEGKEGAPSLADPFAANWNRLQLFFWDGSLSEALSLLHRLFGELSLAGTSLPQCRAMVRKFLERSWEEIGGKSGGKALADASGRGLESLDSQTSLLALMNLSDAFVRSLMATLNEDGANSEALYVRRALTYIESNYMNQISLDLVAGDIGISPYYLSHLFKKQMGITFLQYVTRYRMHRAEKILAETKLPLEAVAERVGYKDAGYFKRIYLQFKANPQSAQP